MNLKLLVIPAMFAPFFSTADTLTFNTVSRGWYDSSGYASPNDNYLTGMGGAGRASWFVFDLSSLTATVSSASFVVYEPLNGYLSNHAAGGSALNATETVGLGALSSSGLIANGSGGHADTYAAIGAGVSYGTFSVSAADNGSYLTFNLNTAGVAGLQAARGGLFAIGAVLASADSDPTTNQFVFQNSHTGNPADGNTSLSVVTAVPESGYAVATLAAVSLAAAVRRRRRAQGAGLMRSVKVNAPGL